MVKCTEFEAALTARESQLTKSLYISHFEIDGLLSVIGISSFVIWYLSIYIHTYTHIFFGTDFFGWYLFLWIIADSRNSLKFLEEELSCLTTKRDEMLKRIEDKRYALVYFLIYQFELKLCPIKSFSAVV